MKTITVEGGNIRDIRTFYDEINRVFMAGEDWRLADSLDALDDMLYGGYGAIRGDEPVRVVWNGFYHTARVLGAQATREWYREKLRSHGTFNTKWAEERLEALDRGEGETYFDMVVGIFATHANIVILRC